MIALLLALIIPTHDGYVTDRAGILSTGDRAVLEQRLREYEQRTTNEVAVLIVPSLEGDSIEEFANRVFHEWGIGKRGRDNGVLFVWSTGDRKVRLEVGYGLEPSLNDGLAGQIIRDTITPRFRASQWTAGVSDGVTAVIAALDRKPAEAVVVTDSRSSPTLLWILLLGVLPLMSIWAVVWTMRIRRKPLSLPLPIEYDVPLHTQVRIRQRNREDESSRRRASPSYAAPDPPTYVAPNYDPPAPSYDPPSVDTGSSFGGFGGGDSGGGGASGSY